MLVDANTMSFVIDPMAIVDVSISVYKSSPTIGFVVSPPAFVHAAIRPDLSSFALTNFICAVDPLRSDIMNLPFTLVSGMILENYHLLPDDRVAAVVGLIIIVELTKFLPDLGYPLIVIILNVVVVVAIVLLIEAVNPLLVVYFSYLLPEEVAPDMCLDLDKLVDLLVCHDILDLVSIPVCDATIFFNGLTTATSAHLNL